MKSTWVLVVIVGTFAGSMFLNLQAQEDENDSSQRLPTYYGKLGVSDTQRDQMYGILDDYDKQIEVLQKQIKSLLKERDGKMEALLSPGQQLRLKELKEESRKRSQKKLSEQKSQAAETSQE